MKKIPGTFQINSAVFLRIAATSARALDDQVEFFTDGRHRGGIGEVERANEVGLCRQLPGRFRGSGPAHDLPSPSMKKIGHHLADIAATGDAISANNSENFNARPLETRCKIDSIFSETVKCSPKISRKSSRASIRLMTVWRALIN